MNQHLKNRGRSWKPIAAFAAVYIVWGSTYLAIRIGVETMPPFFMASLRFLAAGLILFIWRISRGDKIPGIGNLGRNALVGMLTLGCGIGSVGWAEQYIPSSLAAIIVTAVPFWFVLFDRKQWGFYFSNRMILLGLLLGFAGVIILVGFSHPALNPAANSHLQLIGILVMLAGGIAWTSGSLFSRYRIVSSSLLMDAAVQFLIAGIFCMLASVLLQEGKKLNWQQISGASWLAVGYLATMGSLVAYLAYLWLIRNLPPAQVSSYVYVNPIIAVLLGAGIAGEEIGRQQIISLALILFGVVLVNLPKYKHSSH